jgi:hypothetical protein
MTMTTTLLACAVCGAACPDGRVTEAKDVTVVTPAGTRQMERMLDLGTCLECRANAERIAAIVAAHPALLRARGPVGALRAVQNVVTALDVLRQPLPLVAVPDSDLASLIAHLSEVGAGVAARQRATEAGQVAPFRYAFLAEHEVVAVRAAYGGYLHERAMRSAPAVRLAPPRGRGCLFCGVGSVRVAADTLARHGLAMVESYTWEQLATTVTSLGRNSPDRASGSLCPSCSKAREAEGAIGHPAMARALVAHLREVGDDRTADAVESAAKEDRIRLVGWGALAGDPTPNEQPWDHLDLSWPVGR